MGGESTAVWEGPTAGGGPGALQATPGPLPSPLWREAQQALHSGGGLWARRDSPQGTHPASGHDWRSPQVFLAQGAGSGGVGSSVGGLKLGDQVRPPGEPGFSGRGPPAVFSLRPGPSPAGSPCGCPSPGPGAGRRAEHGCDRGGLQRAVRTGFPGAPQLGWETLTPRSQSGSCGICRKIAAHPPHRCLLQTLAPVPLGSWEGLGPVPGDSLFSPLPPGSMRVASPSL